MFPGDDKLIDTAMRYHNDVRMMAEITWKMPNRASISVDHVPTLRDRLIEECRRAGEADNSGHTADRDAHANAAQDYAYAFFYPHGDWTAIQWFVAAQVSRESINAYRADEARAGLL